MQNIFVLQRRNYIIAQSGLHEVMNTRGRAYSLSQAPGKAASAPYFFQSFNKCKLGAIPAAEDKSKNL